STMNRFATGAAALAALFSIAAHAETPVERGRYLVETIGGCANCHTPRGPGGFVAAKHLAGGFVLEEPPFRAVASNITPDKETGIGNWTDAQIAKAIREGIRPDGSVIGPPMPIEFYRRLSDTDVNAMVAYLRTVPAASNKVEKSVYRVPLPPNYGPPVVSVPDVPRTDKVKYGEYLAGPAGHCVECHTPLVRGRRDWSRIGQGGQEFQGPWGVSVARNITPHSADGLGEWTDAEIKRAITEGVSKAGNELFPPMGYGFYAKMRAEDLDALVAYLRSLKPLAQAK
ncbi:MAG: c-type cytochrome, partial [Alphaproteobacteria bacterium]